MEIKVLGPGCPKCQQTATIVKEVLDELGINANIEKITNFAVKPLPLGMGM
ncbi:MAG: thioredoxin family protein [Desulfobacterales bacterium]|nr:thioredoxin family protein [Desulfobacterales bacterium]